MTVFVLARTVLVLRAHLAPAVPSTMPRRWPTSTVCTHIRGQVSGAEETALRALLRNAPTRLLFRRWHGTGRTVAAEGSGQGYDTGVYLRGLLLDEPHTRDPAGTQRWIEQGLRPAPGAAHPRRPGPSLMAGSRARTDQPPVVQATRMTACNSKSGRCRCGCRPKSARRSAAQRTAHTCRS